MCFSHTLCTVYICLTHQVCPKSAAYHDFNPSPRPPSPGAGLRKVMVRAHRQAWCWQDEWYGLTIEDIRLLELETQLALARKMAQYSLTEEGGAAETNGAPVTPDQDQGGAEAPGVAVEAEEGGTGVLGDTLQTRGELTKQWSTSSRSSNRSSKRGGEWVFFFFASL